MMKSTGNCLRESISVNGGWPVRFTDVVTSGIPSSSAMMLIQWFGIRIPIVSVPTDFATAFLLVNLNMNV